MTRLIATSLLACILVVCAAQARPHQDVTFGFVDVIVDTGARPLAAYQVEMRATRGDVTIVGIEGGDGAFANPPYYDPRAMQLDRVIIAAFDTSANPPAGKVRVARIHMRFAGNDAPAYDLRLTTAATTDGTRIDAAATLQDGDR